MTKTIDILYSVVSALTLSGLSPWAESLCAWSPLAVGTVFLLLCAPPWRVLRKGQNRSEALFWCALLLLGALFRLLVPESGRAVALLLMLLGGCEGSLSGGFHAGPLLNSLRLMKRSIILKAHPNAVVGLRRDGAVLDTQNASDETLGVISYMAAQLLLSFFLCFGMDDFSEAMLLSAAALGNNGWILLLLSDASPAALLGSGGKLFLMPVMLAGRALTVLRRKRGK